MLAFLEAFSKHQSYRLRWGELSEAQIPLERTSFLLRMPTTTILEIIASTFLLRIMARLRSYGDFWHATRSEKQLIYDNLISIVGSVISASSYGYGRTIAWSVLVGLGNGIMTSMGPMLYSDVVCQGPEFGVTLASKFRAPLRCDASKTSSVGMLEYPSPDQQRIEASFLSTQVCIF